MHNDIIDPGGKLPAEVVVKPDGSLHLATRFPSSSRSHRKNPKAPTAPWAVAVTENAHPTELKLLEDQESLNDRTRQHQTGRRLLPLSPAIKVLHRSILGAAFYKSHHHGRL